MKRRILMVGTTFFLAAATGHFMQNGIGTTIRGAATPEPAAAARTAPGAAEAAPAVAQAPTEAVLVAGITAPSVTHSDGDLPDLPGDRARALTSGTLLATRMDAVADHYTRPATDADVEYSVFGIPCGMAKLELAVGARGTVKATLSAPCHPDERVVFSHAGLSFAMMTDAAGSVVATIPAMLAEATVDAGFANGEVLSAVREVPDLEGLRRMALSGEGDIHLNAYEDGASYEADGHYSRLRPGDPTSAAGATMVTLGDAQMDAPKTVDIFTASTDAKSVTFEAELVATSTTCGRTVKARVVTMAGGKIGLRETLKQAIPDCNAVGDLVLSPLPGWDGPLAVANSQ